MNKRKNTVIWLGEVTGRKKLYIVYLLLLKMSLAGSCVLYAFLLRNLIDQAVVKNWAGFMKSVAGVTVLVILQLIIRALGRFLQEWSRSTMENQFKERLFSSLMRKDYASIAAIHSGEWMNRLTSDTVVAANGLTDIIPGIAGMLVQLVGAVAAILFIEPRIAYILVPGGCLLLVITYGFRRVLKRMHKDVQEADGAVRVFLQERLGSLMIVRTFAMESQTEKEAEEKMAGHKDARIRRNHFSNLCNIGFGAAMNGAYVFGVAYCGYGILRGIMSYGTLMAVMQLISQIQSPFANITGYLPQFYSVIASAERLMEAEAFAEDCTETYSSDKVRHFYQTEFRKIGLKKAAFTYQPPVQDENATMPVVLSDIDLEIHKGEYVAFTGHSGCGKSTVLKILMCLYPLDSGERYLLGDTEIPLTSAWRGLFAYVPQGNQLMSGTIREIIAFGDKGRMMQEEALRTALRIACADEFVDVLENGMDTILGERGTGLSEGQMQRIAIARAVFSEHPILLLDESTSALDDVTEQKLLTNLREMTDKTVLIVTHRSAVLSIVDKVIQFS